MKLSIACQTKTCPAGHFCDCGLTFPALVDHETGEVLDPEFVVLCGDCSAVASPLF